MDITQILNVALPVVYVLVGLALIVFLIALVRFLHTTRTTVVDLKKQIDPTLAHVETITASLEPVVARVDPLVERVSLTVDAANLEIMRVDQILENVADITEGVSSAVDAVDAAANAPIKLVNSASEKVRGVFKARKASNESIALGNKSENPDALSSSYASADCNAQQSCNDNESEKEAVEEAVKEAVVDAVEKDQLVFGEDDYFTYTPDEKQQ